MKVAQKQTQPPTYPKPVQDTKSPVPQSEKKETPTPSTLSSSPSLDAAQHVFTTDASFDAQRNYRSKQGLRRDLFAAEPKGHYKPSSAPLKTSLNQKATAHQRRAQLDPTPTKPALQKMPVDPQLQQAAYTSPIVGTDPAIVSAHAKTGPNTNVMLASAGGTGQSPAQGTSIDPKAYGALDKYRQKGKGAARLSQGQSGPDVATLKEGLRKLGHSSSPGQVFDAKTTKAVKDFQRANKIGVDGQVGPKTLQAMDKALAQGTAKTLKRSEALLKKYIGRDLTAQEKHKLQNLSNNMDKALQHANAKRTSSRTAVQAPAQSFLARLNNAKLSDNVKGNLLAGMLQDKELQQQISDPSKASGRPAQYENVLQQLGQLKSPAGHPQHAAQMQAMLSQAVANGRIHEVSSAFNTNNNHHLQQYQSKPTDQLRIAQLLASSTTFNISKYPQLNQDFDSVKTSLKGLGEAFKNKNFYQQIGKLTDISTRLQRNPALFNRLSVRDKVGLAKFMMMGISKAGTQGGVNQQTLTKAMAAIQRNNPSLYNTIFPKVQQDLASQKNGSLSKALIGELASFGAGQLLGKAKSAFLSSPALKAAVGGSFGSTYNQATGGKAPAQFDWKSAGYSLLGDVISQGSKKIGGAFGLAVLGANLWDQYASWAVKGMQLEKIKQSRALVLNPQQYVR